MIILLVNPLLVVTHPFVFNCSTIGLMFAASGSLSIFLEIWSVDVFAGTLGFVVTIAMIGLLDVLIDKYQYRSELTGF